MLSSIMARMAFVLQLCQPFAGEFGSDSETNSLVGGSAAVGEVVTF
jgi:hypothetical protein